MWYNELTSALRRLGISPVDGISCCWVSKELIVFSYVDDIVALYVIRRSRMCIKVLDEKLSGIVGGSN